MSKLTTKRRKSLPNSAFVFPQGTKAAPKTRAFPIDTASRARNALSRAAQQAVHLTDVERRAVVKAVCKEYPSIGQCSTGLAGLPPKGRIPGPVIARVSKKLNRKLKACGITRGALREGMEVEREHRDVTHGGVEDTARIAIAHLCERPDYYKRLKRFVET